jgi:SAM-dependent methyltransferase
VTASIEAKLAGEGFGLHEGRVWARRADDAIAYDDGAEGLLDRYFDGDTGPVREAPAEARWPLLYHLSPGRHALLDAVEVGGTVLELGAGMGALTGALLARAEAVVAVEGAPARARVLRKRFAGDARLTVVRADLLGLPFVAEFDVVTSVGVLEYAGEFGPGAGVPAADAPAAFLAACARFLRPGGRLVLAIENAFGAKYWTGCHEDHYGAPFVGIEGYDGSARGVRTFARDELGRLVEAAGFEVGAVYGCWPDYKFPVWLADTSAPPSVLAHLVRELPPTPCYDHAPTRLLRERALLVAAARSDLLGYLWNSYLVVATRR